MRAWAAAVARSAAAFFLVGLMAVTPYCSLTDLQDRLSDEGVNLRLDDKPTVYSKVINRASTKIDQYCRPRYTTANLAVSDWVKEAATTISVFMLCGRRGNPPPAAIAADYEELIDWLKLIASGARNLPDVPMRKTEVPVLSNVRTRLDPFPRTVVEPKISTGKAEGYKQHADRLDWFDYTIALWPVLFTLTCGLSAIF